MSRPFLLGGPGPPGPGWQSPDYDEGVVLPLVPPVPPPGVVELSGAGVVGAGVLGAGLEGAGIVVEGSEPPGLAVSSFLSQAVSATATTEARIKVLLIMLRLLLGDDHAAR